MTTEADIKKIVSDVLRERFAKLGLVNSDVSLEEDFDGDRIVRVIAHFREPGADVAESLFDAADVIRARLIEAGDDRFVFVSRDYPGASAERSSEEDAERTPSS